MTSLFGQWRGTGDGGTPSTAKEDGTANRGAESDAEQDHTPGPMTAPGGWGNLLTWRPSRGEVRPAGVEGADAPHGFAHDGYGDEGGTDDAHAATFKPGDPSSPQQRFATAKTRAKSGAPSTRPRAPIPSFEPLGSSSSSSSASNAPANASIKRNSLKVKGLDSADVSAELTAETSADLSMDAGALDSAFQTLTRIRAKDVAASSAISSPLPLSEQQAAAWSTHKRLVSVSSTEAPSSRKASLAYHTPEESPQPGASPSGWMQWGSARIRATMPRGIASALLAVLGESEGKEAGAVGETIEEDDDQYDETLDADYSAVADLTTIVDDVDVIQDCIDVICGDGRRANLLSTEGIFRVSPSNALLKSTKEAYLRGEPVLLAELSDQDKHLPAALLKDRLRSMRPPLVPESMYEDVTRCPKDREQAVIYLRTTLLPRIAHQNRLVLQLIMGCAHRVASNSEENKMDSVNLALVLTPNLLNGRDVMQDMALCNVSKDGDRNERAKGGTTLGNVVQLCIERYEDVFRAA